jgi:dihydrofolate reductase
MEQRRPREVILIAALAANGVIGRDGALPWRLPEDLKRFRRLTLGHTLLMGRKTFDSLGKPLDGRDNWVLSRDAAFAPAGVRVFASLQAALEAAPPQLFAIGGADLYAQLLPQAQRLELTEVHAEVSGDAFFPAIDRSQWREVAREDHSVDDRHAWPYSFVTLERR